jgi:hypothetical protein
MLWPDPAQRPRIAEIRDNLISRISEAEREGWLGEIEGLKISLTGADDKLAQIDRRSKATNQVDLGMPTFLPHNLTGLEVQRTRSIRSSMFSLRSRSSSARSDSLNGASGPSRS